MTSKAAGPTLIPGLSYEDARGAIDWLVGVLGLRLAELHEDARGGVAFARLVWRGGMVFVSGRSGTAPWSQVGIASLCLVAEDEAAVEAHYRRALAAGADFVRPLHTSRSPAFPHGVSAFDLRDPGGHLWTISNYQPR